MKYKKLMILGTLALLSLLSFAIAGHAIAGTIVLQDEFHVIL